MSDASTIAFSELAEVNPRVSLQAHDDNLAVSFISMSDVSEGGKWTNRQERRLGDVRFGYTAFLESDLLFAKITPCMENGKGAHVIGLKNGIGCGSTEFHVLRAKEENNARYLHHWLQASMTRIKAIAYMGGSAGQQRVHAQFFDRYRVPKLSPTEQCQAANILDTADEAIAKTEAVVAKLRQVRTGLIHDLLTCGLDENGRLRDPIAHPEQFKESPCGRIPKTWAVVRIADEAEIQHGHAFEGRYFTDKPLGPRLLVPGNFHRDGGLHFTDDNTKYYSGSYSPEYILNGGDILIVMTDLSPMTLILGRVVLFADRFTLLHNQRIGKFQLKHPDAWNPKFFVAMMNDQRLRHKIIREATGTTVRHTSPDRIRSAVAFRPNPDEQREIVAHFSQIDSAIEASVNESSKLRCLRSGLMEALLTGRVRLPEATP